MPFDRDQVSTLLAHVQRRCCICHRFCGVKIETDHILPLAEGGDDTIENAIPVCFECHAEIHSYNDQHPRGRKFLPNELRAHKERWLRTCEERPDLFLTVARTADVGPLQALVDELEFNKTVAGYYGALFADEQFRRATAQGAIAILEPTLRARLLDAYAAMSLANQRILAEANQDAGTRVSSLATNQMEAAIRQAVPKISVAHEQLLRFLSSES